ncbi:MAG: ATP-dependent zinc metalloprotease FtsH [Patescibacteria group bacterium]
MNTPKPRNSLFYLLIITLIGSTFYIVQSSNQVPSEKININALAQEITEGRVESIKIIGDKIEIHLIDKSKQFTYKEPSADILQILSQYQVPKEKIEKLNIEVEPSEGNFWVDLLINILPFALVIGFLMMMMRSAQSSNNQAMSFGKTNARLYDKEKQKTTFSDVAGAKEAKEELVEIVDFLKNPKKYTALGAKTPKGVLLIGSPGCGKTLLARAIAGEADVPFFNISGSEFVEMFVGVGASRVRDLFKKAKRNSPCIIFIDEIDAVGRHRGAGMGGGHDEREQTLNQILTEMDGFETETHVIVVAATNRPDVLDPALLRPGRFDRRIVVDMPDIQDRTDILKVHSRNKPLTDEVDLLRVAQQTPGFSGADLENLMNEAAILAARNDKKTISMEMVEQAVEKVALGPEKKSRVLSEEEKKITAYHETGHAVVGHLLDGCDPVHKVSIISRGMALGVTWYLPEEDKHLKSKSQFEHQIAAAIGGYAAEKMFFKEVTTGPSSDLEKATNMARAMVTHYGMSEMGPMIFGGQSNEIFLGRDYGHVKNYSEEVAGKIDSEVKKIIQKGYDIATKILTENKEIVIEIAEKLIKKETLNREEFGKFFKKKTSNGKN